MVMMVIMMLMRVEMSVVLMRVMTLIIVIIQLSRGSVNWLGPCQNMVKVFVTISVNSIVNAKQAQLWLV